MVDDGTSGGIEALQRQQVLEAIDQATTLKCDGIVVEAHDRWTRAGPEDFWVSKFFLRLDHNLRLVVANVPDGMSEEMVEAWDSMQAAMAKAFRTRLREQIKSGLARAKRNGWPNGVPGRLPKPNLTAEEYLWVAKMREWKHCPTCQGIGKVPDPKAIRDGPTVKCRPCHGKGQLPPIGFRTVAIELSKKRGFADVADVRVQKERKLSETWLRAEMVRCALQAEARQYRPVQTVQVETAEAKS